MHCLRDLLIYTYKTWILCVCFILVCFWWSLVHTLNSPVWWRAGMAEVVTTKVSAKTVKSTWIEDNLISMMKISHAAKRISQYYMGYPQKTVEHQLLYCEELIDLRESLLPLAPLVKPISWRKHHNTIWLHLESDSYWRLYCHFCKAIPNIHAELFMKMCSIRPKVGQLRYRSENLYDNLELV